VLTACASGPSQVTSAAIIGGSSVPLAVVQQRLDTVLRKEPQAKQLQQQHQLDGVSRSIVTLAVRHDLIGKAAQQEGLTVNQEQITQLIDQLGGADKASAGTVYDASTFRERASDQLLLVALARKYVDRLAVTFDFTQASSRAAALAKANKIASDPAKATEIINSDRAAGVAAGTNQRLTVADNPQLATTALFGALPGTVVTFPLDQNSAASNGQWLVALIRQRSTDAAPASGSTTPTNASQLDPRLLEGIGIRLLAPVAEQVGVRVSPRYGVWDSVGMSVVPTANDTVGLAVAAHTQP
jgi:hypothetical protein